MMARTLRPGDIGTILCGDNRVERLSNITLRKNIRARKATQRYGRPDLGYERRRRTTQRDGATDHSDAEKEARDAEKLGAEKLGRGTR